MRTAQLHQCPFCVDSHTELTRIAGQGEIDPDDPGTVRAELRAVRAFLDTTQTARPGVTGVPHGGAGGTARRPRVEHRQPARQREVFELTVAAAVGAALRTYDTGQRALENNPG